MGGPAANIRSEFFVHDEDFEDLFRLTKFHIQMSPRRQFRKSMRKGEKRIFKIFSKNNRVRRSSFVSANKDITAALSKHTFFSLGNLKERGSSVIVENPKRSLSVLFLLPSPPWKVQTDQRRFS